MKEMLEVWMDADFLSEQLLVGLLHNDDGTTSTCCTNGCRCWWLPAPR